MIRAIWIYGKPVPKGRPRFSRGGGVYTPKTTADYEKRIAKAWRDKYGDVQYESNELIIHVDVYTSKYSTSDVDNFLKIAMDGLQGVAFENDSSIRVAKVIKIRVDSKGSDEGMRIAILETGDMLTSG